MAAAFRRNSARVWMTAAALAVAAASGAMAQDAPDPDDAQVNTAHSLKLPQNPQVFGAAIPSVIKATAIVNGDVITQTDVDQRLAGWRSPTATRFRRTKWSGFGNRCLRNLIDETLEIQAAKSEKIEIKKSDIDRTVARVAASAKQTPEQMTAYLQSNGSSIQTMRRQIEGEIAWQRLQSAKIESGISVGDDEVKAVLDRLNASKGVEEYHVGEIFLSATPGDREPDPRQCQQDPGGAAQRRILCRLCPTIFGGFDGRGRRRPWLGPSRAAPGALATTLREMTAGTVSSPIMVPGGVSILAVQDTRKILTADPRDAVLTSSRFRSAFRKARRRQAAEPIAAQFGAASRTIGGCGGAEKLAADFHGEVVTAIR